MTVHRLLSALIPRLRQYATEVHPFTASGFRQSADELEDALYPSPGDRDDSEECARCAALFASYGERFPEGSVVRCHTHRPISEEQR